MDSDNSLNSQQNEQQFAALLAQVPADDRAQVLADLKMIAAAGKTPE